MIFFWLIGQVLEFLCIIVFWVILAPILFVCEIFIRLGIVNNPATGIRKFDIPKEWIAKAVPPLIVGAIGGTCLFLR
jgi:hypothetical protein